MSHRLVRTIQTVPVDNTSPNDGYVLTYSATDGYWAPKPSTGGGFTAGGDLTGTSTSQTVAKINGHTVASQSLGPAQDGYVLTWDNTASNWIGEPNLGGGGGGAPTGPAAGDLTGTYPNPIVANIKSHPVATQTLSSGQDGYVLTWSNTDGYWVGKASAGGGGGGPTGAAGGDLSGTYPNPTVAKLQGRAVNSVTPTDGYVLTWDNPDGYWLPKPLSTTSLQYVLPHTTAFGPIALYQFDGNLNDSSGNSRTLTLDAGTSRYVDISPNLRGFAFDGSTRLRSTDTTFNILGDVSFEMLIHVQTTGSDRVIVSSMDVGETLATNYLYAMYLINSGLYSQAFWEFSTGTNVQYDNTSGSFPVGEIFHYAMVRQSNTIAFYINGRLSGTVSGTLTAPATTAGTQKFYVGSNTTDNGFVGILSSLKVFNFALNSSQIASEYQLTLGNAFNRGLIIGTNTNLSGNTVSPQTMGSSTDGYALVWSQTDGYWAGRPLSPKSVQLGRNYSNNFDMDVFANVTSTASATFANAGTFEFDPTTLTAANGTRTITLRVVGETTGPQLTVQLFNYTTASAVTGSTLTTTSTIPVLLTTSDLTANLTNGPAIYQVQIKMAAGGSSDRVFLDMAKLRITWS